MKAKHSLWCRMIMALAKRRVCTCGASEPHLELANYHGIKTRKRQRARR